jgi:hypothetical protein
VDVSLINTAFIVRDASGSLRRDVTKDDTEVDPAAPAGSGRHRQIFQHPARLRFPELGPDDSRSASTTYSTPCTLTPTEKLRPSPIYAVRWPWMPTSRNRYDIREMDWLAGETGGAAFDASKKHVASLPAQEELLSLYDNRDDPHDTGS